MSLRQKIKTLRKKKNYTPEELADLLDVRVATVNSWEKGKSIPRDTNLEALAIVFDTSTGYLLGKTSSSAPNCELSETLEAVYKEIAAKKHNLCKLCGKPVCRKNTRCHECRWRTRWAGRDLSSSWFEKSRKRSHSVQLLSLDRKKPEAIFKATKGGTYTTTLETCTCKDFEFNGGPCKHIFRLAEELGLFYCEHFEAGEYDYTMKSYMAGQERLSLRITSSLMGILELIAYREKTTLWEQVKFFLEHSVAQYLKDNHLEHLEVCDADKAEGI